MPAPTAAGLVYSVAPLAPRAGIVYSHGLVSTIIEGGPTYSFGQTPDQPRAGSAVLGLADFHDPSDARAIVYSFTQIITTLPAQAGPTYGLSSLLEPEDALVAVRRGSPYQASLPPSALEALFTAQTVVAFLVPEAPTGAEKKEDFDANEQ